MKNILTLAFLFFTVLASSQNEKFSFSLEGTLGFSDVLFFDESAPINTSESNRYNLIIGTFSSDFGGIANIQLSKRIELQTGVKVLYQASSFTLEDLRWGTDFEGFDSNSEPIIFSSAQTPISVGFLDQSYFAEIPLRLNFQMKGKLRNFKFSIGQSPTLNFLNRRKTTKSYNTRSEDDIFNVEDDNSIDFRRLNFNTHIGFIWKKKMRKGKYFYLFPNTRVQTLGISKDASLKRRYFMTGISAGISI